VDATLPGSPLVLQEPGAACTGNESPTYAGSSQPTEAIFFAFRLKAPGCFFWVCASTLRFHDKRYGYTE
jgi:hypothetical protein